MGHMGIGAGAEAEAEAVVEALAKVEAEVLLRREIEASPGPSQNPNLQQDLGHQLHLHLHPHPHLPADYLVWPVALLLICGRFSPGLLLACPLRCLKANGNFLFILELLHLCSHHHGLLLFCI
ncbi:hypothetical protein ACFE04_016744 [Oxalis oulophora]